MTPHEAVVKNCETIVFRLKLAAASLHHLLVHHILSNLHVTTRAAIPICKKLLFMNIHVRLWLKALSKLAILSRNL